MGALALVNAAYVHLMTGSCAQLPINVTHKLVNARTRVQVPLEMKKRDQMTVMSSDPVLELVACNEFDELIELG